MVVEVFTWFAKKIADAIVGDAIKSIKDKPKKLGQVLLDSHLRLKELNKALENLELVLIAVKGNLEGNKIVAGELKPYARTSYFFFEDEELLAGADIAFRGWRRDEDDDMVPYFCRKLSVVDDVDPFEDHDKISYQEFLPIFAEHIVRETYRALQKAAISLKRNLNDISDHLLSVVQPELYSLLSELARYDYRLAYWVFQCPPSIEFDENKDEISFRLTVMNEPNSTVPGDILGHAASFPVEYEDSTIVDLKNPDSIVEGLTVIRGLRQSLDSSSEGLASCIRENWKLQDLI